MKKYSIGISIAWGCSSVTSDPHACTCNRFTDINTTKTFKWYVNIYFYLEWFLFFSPYYYHKESEGYDQIYTEVYKKQGQECLNYVFMVIICWIKPLCGIVFWSADLSYEPLIIFLHKYLGHAEGRDYLHVYAIAKLNPTILYLVRCKPASLGPWSLILYKREHKGA